LQASVQYGDDHPIVKLGTSLGQLEEKVAATQAEGAQIMTEARWVSQEGPGWCEWLNKLDVAE